MSGMNLSERETLVYSLNAMRAKIIDSCALLTDDKARQALVVSPTTALGIVRHLIAVEQYWFRHILAGGAMADDWADVQMPDPEWVVDGLAVHPMLDIYRNAIDESNTLIGNVSLDAQAKLQRDGEHPSLRWILVHMIEETAAHSGHMDILVEQLINYRRD